MINRYHTEGANESLIRSKTPQNDKKNYLSLARSVDLSNQNNNASYISNRAQSSDRVRSSPVNKSVGALSLRYNSSLSRQQPQS